MAGHSKWANIKHRKAAQDKKRGKQWTRIVKEITIAASDGGTDVESNPKLRLAVQNGKGANIPKDTIERAIKKASGEDGAVLQETTYEGYAPHGIAIYVECTTDNLNRTVAAVRSYFTKNGGRLGTNGSLEFIFDRKGVFNIDREAIKDHNPEALELEWIDGGANEVEFGEETTLIYTAFEAFGSMQAKLEAMKIEVKNAELQRIPNNTKTIPLNEAREVLRLIGKFEEDDDVQNVFHNLEMTDELAAVLENED